MAVFIKDSSGVELTRVDIHARDGVDGADGTLTPFSAGAGWPVQSSLDGQDGLGVASIFNEATAQGGPEAVAELRVPTQ